MRSRADDIILDGEVDDGSPIAELMRALQAPDSPDEFAGLDRAMSAFFTVGPATRAAAPLIAPSPTPHRHRNVAAGRRALVLKLATLFGGASLIGGMALAAHVIGGGPSPSHHRPPQPSNGVQVSGAPNGSLGVIAPTHVSAHPSKSAPGKSASKTAGGGGPAHPSNHPSHPTHPTHPSHPSHPTHPTAKHTPTATASSTIVNTKKPNPGQSHRASAPGRTKSHKHTASR